jgi:hypothetical protein
MDNDPDELPEDDDEPDLPLDVERPGDRAAMNILWSIVVFVSVVAAGIAVDWLLHTIGVL